MSEGDTSGGASTSGSTKRRVVIIGAGLAGLSAARHLVNHGSYDVTILEARPDRYGGRIHSDSVTFSANTTVDLGASWIHGACADHPITQLQQTHNASVFTTQYDKIVVSQEASGEKYATVKLLYEYYKYGKMVSKVMKAAARYENDMSIKEALEHESLNEISTRPSTLFFKTEIEAVYAAPLSRVSSKQLAHPLEQIFDGKEQIFKDGYVKIVDGIVNGKGERPLDIQLGKVVRKIRVDSEKKTAKIKLADGTRLEADSVIVTVPLGVLKAGNIKFRPRLPQDKLEAIHNLGNGLFNKLVLEFDEVFWSRGVHFFGVAPREEADSSMLVYWLNMAPALDRPILFGLITGDAALDSEQLSDDELKEKGLQRLRCLFGEAVVNSHTVVHMARTKWAEDAFAMGSYSYPAVGNSGDEWRVLGEPVLPCLHFAGEHTITEYHSTTHGAYLSGRRAALEISSQSGLPPVATPPVVKQVRAIGPIKINQTCILS